MRQVALPQFSLVDLVVDLYRLILRFLGTHYMHAIFLLEIILLIEKFINCDDVYMASND
jgi:hypothetical protein